jgi:aspartate kinase
VFSTISDINVSLISQGASSINFTFAIEDARVEEAVQRLHEEFFTKLQKQSNVDPGTAGVSPAVFR